MRYLADTDAILRETSALVAAARDSIILQMYLFAGNGELEVLLARDGAPAHAALVADWLISKRRREPHVALAVILDSNTPAEAAHTRARRLPLRAALEQAGISVLHASLFDNTFDARSGFASWGKPFHVAWPSCPPAELRVRQNRWQVRKNIEDHRKNLVIDRGKAGLLTSHNFVDVAHDWRENGFVLEDAAATELWKVASYALGKSLLLPHTRSAAEESGLHALARLPALTETAPTSTRLLHSREIRPQLLELARGAVAGDTLYAASAYFSDLPLLEALVAAATRGATVKVLIDSIAGLPLPFPLRSLIPGLVNHGVISRARRHGRTTPRFELRVHDSRSGRVMHLKTCARFGAEPLLIGGQANFTPNSFSGAWLETDVMTRDAEVLRAFRAQFEELWGLPEARPLAAPNWRRTCDDRARDAALWGFKQLGLEP